MLPVRIDQDPLVQGIAVDHHRPAQVIRVAQQGQVSAVGSVEQHGLVQAHLRGYFFQLGQRRGGIAQASQAGAQRQDIYAGALHLRQARHGPFKLLVIDHGFVVAVVGT